MKPACQKILKIKRMMDRKRHACTEPSRSMNIEKKDL